jgi:S-layer protein (TIGR01567 family)
MKEIANHDTHRKHTHLKSLGIMALAFLMLVSIVGAAPFAYITNTGDNTVSVIDTATNTVSPNPIYVGNAPYGVAVSLDGTRAYVTNGGSFNVAGTVSVIDTSDNNVIDTYTVEKKPMGIAINPSGTKVYVANYVSGTVSVIDTVSKTIKPVTVGMGPVGVAISPDGSKVYVTNELSYTVSEIDIATDTVNPNPIYVGMQPWGIAVTPDGSKAYVANEEGHTVSVINTATRDVKPVSLGGYNHGIAVSPDGSEVYVTSEDDNDAGSVYVIDTATDTVVLPPIHVGKLPTGVSFSLNGNYAYVANSGSNTVSIIDTASKVVNTVTVGKVPQALGQFICPAKPTPIPTPIITWNNPADITYGKVLSSSQLNAVATDPVTGNTVPGTFFYTPLAGTVLDVGTHTLHVEFKPQDAANYSTASKDVTINVKQSLDGETGVGPFAYISHIDSYNISVIDTATNTVTATVNIGDCSFGVAVTPDGKKVYVTHIFSNTVSVIDTNTNTVTATVDVGRSPLGVAVNPTGTKVYVTNAGGWFTSPDKTVSVIDIATDTVTATVDVGNSPYGVAVTPDGKKVYVANVESDTVSVINTATDTVTATVNVGTAPYGVSVTPDGTKVYVVNSGSDTVSVIDPATDTVTATVTAGDHPEGIVANPAGTKVYVTNSYDGTVSVIDTATNKVTAKVEVGFRPKGVAITPDGKKIYVANCGILDWWGETISVIDTTTNTVTDEVNVDRMPCAFGQFIGPLPNTSFDIKNVIGTDYQHGEWGQYPTIDIFGEKHVTLFAKNNSIWQSHVNKLAKLVLDSSGNYYLKVGEKLDLGQGYSLEIKQIDVDGEKVWLEFYEDGQYVDDHIISAGTVSESTWTCTLDNIEGVNDVPVLKVHVNQVSLVGDDIIVQIDGIWLIDYVNTMTLNIGDQLGEFKLTSIVNGVDESDLGSLVFESTSTQPLPPIFPGYTNPPTDLDHDNLYEDINGNRGLDFDDVVVYYDNMDWIEENVQIELFDYNENGGIDFDDVVKLYDML